MELTQIKGDTWVLEADELIPLVRLEGDRCVLLDTGLRSEWEALAAALAAHRLTPVGVFASHAHRDHMGNSFCLRETYGARISLPEGESALCTNPALYRGGYDTFTPAQILKYYGHLLGRVDETVGPEDGPVAFCGVPFTVIHTPGHSPDHICTLTPDGVLYGADALLGADFLASAKLPYHYTHALARQSMEKLRGVPCAAMVAAHRTVTSGPDALVDDNFLFLDAACHLVLDELTEAMTLDELVGRLALGIKMLTSRLEKACLFARNVRTFSEYLVDVGKVEITVRDGARYYSRIG